MLYHRPLSQQQQQQQEAQKNLNNIKYLLHENGRKKIYTSNSQ
ncbi:hypothetical protein ACMBCN_00550 [Candidatus Liberibacter asiaticus]